jgi:hypothetical protein
MSVLLTPTLHVITSWITGLQMNLHVHWTFVVALLVGKR